MRARQPWNSGETYILRDMLAEQVGRRPRRAQELFELVRDQWGQVGERRLWRALRWLVQRGVVKPVAPEVSRGVRFRSEGYVLGSVSSDIR